MFKRVEIEGKKRELENQTKGVKRRRSVGGTWGRKKQGIWVKKTKQNKMNIQ